MILNFSNKYQFGTRLMLKNKNVEFKDSTKLLGTILTSDLKWNENTKYLVIKAYKRMELLRRIVKFSDDKQELKNIYILFIRSILEQSAPVWHSGLSVENIEDFERVQKSACKLILQQNYTDYDSALRVLDLEKLSERRKKLCWNFSKNCLKHEKFKNLFPEKSKSHKMKMRKEEKFAVFRANTKRLDMSALNFMRRQLNEEQAK